MDDYIDRLLDRMLPREDDGWEFWTPTLERRRKPGGGWEVRPKPGRRGAAGLGKVETPSAARSLGAAALEAARGVPSRIKEGIFSAAELPAHLINPLIPASPAGRLQAVPERVFGEEGSVGQELRQSVRRERDEARERLQEAARGLPAPAAAVLDTAAEGAAVVLDPTNFLPATGALKAGRGLETAGQRALRRAGREAAPAARAVSKDLQELAEKSLAIGASPEAAARPGVHVLPGSRSGPNRTLLAVDDAGREVGSLAYTAEPEGGFTAHLIETGQRGTGAGRELLRAAAAETGGPLRGTAAMTPEGEGFFARVAATDPDLVPPHLTSLKNAVVAEERAARGLPAIEKLGKAKGAAWEEARARVDADPLYARELAQEIVKKPRVLSDVESHALLHDRMRISNDYRQALADEERALWSGDRGAWTVARTRRAALETAQEVADEAADRAGTEWHRAGQARQLLIREDYSPVRLVSRVRVATRGKGAPEAEAKVVAIAGRLDGALADLAADEAGAVTRAAERALRRAKREAEKETLRTGRRGSGRDLASEFAGFSAEFGRKAATPRAGLDPELGVLVFKMARNRVRAGVNSLDQVVEEIRAAVRNAVDLDPADVREAIATGAPRQPRAPDPAQQRFVEIREQARLVGQLELAEQGLPVLTRGGKPRRLAPPEVIELRKKLKSVLAEHGVGPGSDASRLAALRKRLEAKAAEYEQTIAAGVRPPKPPRRPPPLDQQTIAMRARVERLKREADDVVAGVELANRTGFEKALDWTVGFGRMAKLTSSRTLLKLPASGVARVFLFNPIREVIGAPLSRLPGPAGRLFRERAPIEGGFSGEAIVKSWARFFSADTRAAVWGHLRRMEEDPLTLAHGGDAYLADSRGALDRAPRWMRYPGNVHAAIEDVPVKYASYELAVRKQDRFARAMETQGREILARGGDLTDPLEQLNAEARAFEWATRQVFMQDDPLVKFFRRLVARKPGDPGETYAVKAFVESLLPIVKVPTNIFKERMEYATGLATGVIRLRRAIKNGIETVPYEEGDAIARQLKNGVFGLGLAWLGWAAADHLGGYWTGQRPRKGEPAEGEIQLFGVNIPQMLADHPALMQLQFFATMRKMADRYGDGGAGRGAAAASLGTIKGLPFAETPFEIVEAVANSARGRNRGVQSVTGSYLRGMTLPPDVQRRARIQDQPGQPTVTEQVLQQIGLKRHQARKRRADDLWEELLLGVPGLRETVD